MELAIFENFSQRLTDFQATVVVDVFAATEAIHEEIDAGARGSDHFGEDLVAEYRNLDDWRTTFVQVSQAQKDASEALLG